MALEIERKFLVEGDGYKAAASRSMRIMQGYLSLRAESTVRVRIRDREAFLTIKGLTTGCVRHEFEYAIPLADAELMLTQMAEGTVIHKTRYLVPFGGLTWEVDEFHSPHPGLVVAEVELANPDQPVELPSWAGREVTDDPRYYNSSLAQLKDN